MLIVNFNCNRSSDESGSNIALDEMKSFHLNFEEKSILLHLSDQSEEKVYIQ